MVVKHLCEKPCQTTKAMSIILFLNLADTTNITVFNKDFKQRYLINRIFRGTN